MREVIERQAAIDAIHCNIVVTGRENAELVAKTMGEFVDRIKALPSIQPEKAQLSQQGTTKDTISRQAALEKVRAMQTYKLFMGDDMILVDKAEVQTELMMLPPAQPEVRTGKWALGFDNRYMEKYYYCSCCGGRKYGEHEPLDYFCSNCGADMRGEKDG